jgi:capsular polysaccharide biosynthesis protein
MDLLALSRTMWRHKIAVIPVLVLVLLGLVYVVKVKPPTYQSDTSLILNIPQPPTQQELLSNPKLAKLDYNNPYITLADEDPLFVGDAVTDLLTNPSAQQTLLSEGVDPKYQVSLSSDPGSPPIINIVGVGTTAAEAESGAVLISKAALADLLTMQLRDGVSTNSPVLITAEVLVKPTKASASISSKLRTLIEVLALGVIMLFVVISVAEAFSRRREEEYELDVPPAVKTRSLLSRDDRDGREPVDHTQEFASPFLSSAARRPVHSLSETRSALPPVSAVGDVDALSDDDD